MSSTNLQRTLVTRDLSALDLPGTLVILDPDQADEMGAVREDAITLEEALEADLAPEE